jgi:serine/threonine protein phosphatase 1
VRRQLISGAKPRMPRVPERVRIYAVGDVHGRADLLDQVLSRVDKDLTTYPDCRPLQVFIGDYIDRGSSSKAVLDRLVERAKRHSIVCLKGNHEAYLLEFLQDPEVLVAWRPLGGLETLSSYGLVPSLNPDHGERVELAAALAAALPLSHQRFLQGLRYSFTCGDFFFVHAGVKPGIPLARQQEKDLLWIREEFLFHERSFGKIIVHGHTPVHKPDIRVNRINIDTGAYATGRLTCLIIENGGYFVLSPEPTT